MRSRENSNDSKNLQVVVVVVVVVVVGQGDLVSRLIAPVAHIATRVVLVIEVPPDPPSTGNNNTGPKP